jgi:hypothetical protein
MTITTAEVQTLTEAELDLIFGEPEVCPCPQCEGEGF